MKQGQCCEGTVSRLWNSYENAHLYLLQKKAEKGIHTTQMLVCSSFAQRKIANSSKSSFGRRHWRLEAQRELSDKHRLSLWGQKK